MSRVVIKPEDQSDHEYCEVDMCDNDALIVKGNMQIAPQTLVPICSEIQGFESDSEANGDVVKVKLEVFMGFANCLCYLKCFHMTAYDDDDDNVYDF